MILDELGHLDTLNHLGDNFRAAAEFLEASNLATLEVGRHDINGDSIYALVMRGEGRNTDEAKLEIHRRYIDIQILLDGAESIGWRPTSDCTIPEDEYDPDKDIQFFDDPPQNMLRLNPGQFAVFFPEDAHMPMIGQGELHKIVVKIRRD